MCNQRPFMNLMFFVFTMLIAFAFSSEHAFAGQDHAAIDRVRLDFNKAYNESNAQALAQVLDKDAVWMPPGELTLVGKDKIEARYKGFFAKVRSSFELKAGDIQPGGDFAYMSGEWNRTDTPKAGGAATMISGHYLIVLKKQADGTWKIARDIWNQPATP